MILLIQVLIKYLLVRLKKDLESIVWYRIMLANANKNDFLIFIYIYIFEIYFLYGFLSVIQIIIFELNFSKLKKFYFINK